MVQVLQRAPDFRMEGVLGDEFTAVTLSDYQDKWVVLFFWPLDFSFVCPTEVTEFGKRHGEFEDLDAVVFGASTDSKYAHKAWAEQIGRMPFPLLSDITKEVSRNYGILLEDQGIALRGTFIIDPGGKLRYQSVHDLDVGRSVDEVLRVLKALQTGHLCPVEWTPGEATLGAGIQK